MPDLVFRPVVMDRKLDVVFLDELFNAGKNCGGWITRDNNGDTGSLAVLELATNIVIVVFWKIDGSGSVELDARRGVIGQGLSFRCWIHGKMILHVLAVEVGQVELFHKSNYLRAREIAERVTGQPQMDGRRLSGRWHPL